MAQVLLGLVSLTIYKTNYFEEIMNYKVNYFEEIMNLKLTLLICETDKNPSVYYLAELV